MSFERTHRCGELRKEHIDQVVVVCGWVHRRRDHGGVIFIDLRDRTGLVQVVFNPEVIAPSLCRSREAAASSSSGSKAKSGGVCQAWKTPTWPQVQ